MHANWQSPYAASGFSSGNLGVAHQSDLVPPRQLMGAQRRQGRDRFGYWLIFAVSLLLFTWLGLIERCNPLFWTAGRRGKARSLWASSREGAHHCATIAFQG